MRLIGGALFLAFLATTPTSAAAQQDRDEAPTHTEEKLADVQAAIEKGCGILLDVREVNEWRRGHLEVAELLPLSLLQTNRRNEAFQDALAVRLPKDKPIYCHCQRGVRAIDAMIELRRLGYDARALKQGFPALVEAGLHAADEQDRIEHPVILDRDPPAEPEDDAEEDAANEKAEADCGDSASTERE